MSVFEMVAVIAVSACFAKIVTAYFKHHNRDQPGMSADQLLRLHALEQRVKHLEAVVSEPEHRLREEFADLERKPG